MYLVVSHHLVHKLLVLEREFDVVSSPIVVKEFVGDFVFFLEAELNSQQRDVFRFAHDRLGGEHCDCWCSCVRRMCLSLYCAVLNLYTSR